MVAQPPTDKNDILIYSSYNISFSEPVSNEIQICDGTGTDNGSESVSSNH